MTPNQGSPDPSEPQPGTPSREGGFSQGTNAPLADRVPGQAVISKLMEVQAQAVPQTWTEKIGGVDPLLKDSKSWYQGAVGEIKVGKTLARLGPEWTVLHAVPVGTRKGDLDHVLIGPAGVFTINTKHHRHRTVEVNGDHIKTGKYELPYTPAARREAAKASTSLKRAVGKAVGVEAIVVFVGVKQLIIHQAPAGVAVMTHRKLLPWLKHRPLILNSQEVSDIAAAAMVMDTWHRRPPAVGEPAFMRSWFNDLRRQVIISRLVRLTWTAVMLIGIVSIPLYVLYLVSSFVVGLLM